MKTTITFLLWLGAGALSFGQGQVNFNNGISFLSATDQSRLVYAGLAIPGNELVGTQFRAQLYYGANAGSLVAVATTGNVFRAPGTTQPGTWANPGFRTLEGFVAGETVILQVRVWDSTGGLNTWEAAYTAGASVECSAPFSYVVPRDGGGGPTYGSMEGLRATTSAIPCPEPSITSLLILCLALAVRPLWRLAIE